jgi:hypothetical protein
MHYALVQPADREHGPSTSPEAAARTNDLSQSIPAQARSVCHIPSSWSSWRLAPHVWIHESIGGVVRITFCSCLEHYVRVQKFIVRDDWSARSARPPPLGHERMGKRARRPCLPPPSRWCLVGPQEAWEHERAMKEKYSMGWNVLKPAWPSSAASHPEQGRYSVMIWHICSVENSLDDEVFFWSRTILPFRMVFLRWVIARLCIGRSWPLRPYTWCICNIYHSTFITHSCFRAPSFSSSIQHHDLVSPSIFHGRLLASAFGPQRARLIKSLTGCNIFLEAVLVHAVSARSKSSTPPCLRNLSITRLERGHVDPGLVAGASCQHRFGLLSLWSCLGPNKAETRRTALRGLPRTVYSVPVTCILYIHVCTVHTVLRTYCTLYRWKLAVHQRGTRASRRYQCRDRI